MRTTAADDLSRAQLSLMKKSNFSDTGPREDNVDDIKPVSLEYGQAHCDLLYTIQRTP
jgi:hypothetical protein